MVQLINSAPPSDPRHRKSAFAGGSADSSNWALIDFSTSGNVEQVLVTIVQPYIPAYRRPFFDGLNASLARDGIELAVLAAKARGGSGSPQRLNRARVRFRGPRDAPRLRRA